jgi:membrane protease YdiL (CAAX protease family)
MTDTEQTDANPVMAEHARTAPAWRLKPLPAFLFRAERWWLYVLVAAALSLAGAALLSLLAQALFPQAATPDLGNATGPTLVALVAVVSPILESLIMSGPLLLANRIAGPRVAVIASAVLWGVLHSLAAPIWGLTIWWPFLIFWTAFLVWRTRGYWVAVGTASVIHALNNLGPALVLAAAAGVR